MRFMGKFQLVIDESKLGNEELTLEYVNDAGRPAYMIKQGGRELGLVPDSFKKNIFYHEPYILQIANKYQSFEGCVLEINYLIAKEYVPIYKKKMFWIVLLSIGAAAVCLSQLMVQMHAR